MPAQVGKHATDLAWDQVKAGDFLTVKAQKSVGPIYNDFAIAKFPPLSLSPIKPKRKRKSTAKSPDALAKTARCYRVTIHSGMCPKKMAASIEDAIYQYFVEQRHQIFIAHVKVVLEIPVKCR